MLLFSPVFFFSLTLNYGFETIVFGDVRSSVCRRLSRFIVFPSATFLAIMLGYVLLIDAFWIRI